MFNCVAGNHEIERIEIDTLAQRFIDEGVNKIRLGIINSSCSNTALRCINTDYLVAEQRKSAANVSVTTSQITNAFNVFECCNAVDYRFSQAYARIAIRRL